MQTVDPAQTPHFVASDLGLYIYGQALMDKISELKLSLSQISRDRHNYFELSVVWDNQIVIWW